MLSIEWKPLAITLFMLAVARPSGAVDGAVQTSNDVVAKQGNATVTLEDIDAFAARIPAGQRAGFFNSPTRIEGVITNMLLQKQMADEARKSGLDRDPLVARQLALAADEALSKARMQQFKDTIKLPDFDQLAHEDYIAHKEKYIKRGQIVVKHVLVSTKTRSEDDARKLAETIEKEAKAQPDQFDALVDKYSDDPGKETNHGEMADAGDSSKYVPEFAAASSALKKVGDISPPVKSTFGFHVVKLTERTTDAARSFAEVKPEIVSRLRNEYIDKQVRTYSDTLRNQPLDANEANVASLRSRYGQVSSVSADAEGGTVGATPDAGGNPSGKR